MSSSLPLGIAIVGCGDISNHYARSLKTRPDLVRLIAACDLRADALGRFCQEYDCEPRLTLEALLADDRVSVVVNLTFQSAHAEVTRACLQAGKHVFSEKPLALSRPEANPLVALAEEKGLRLSGAPFTWMGEAQQTVWRALREGMIGEVRVVYAEMTAGSIESWHRAPASFYAAGVGPLPDIGVYDLAILTTLFGPVAQVSGFGRIVLPERRTLDGGTFTVEAPDVIVGGLEFASGPIGRLTASFYGGPTKQQGIEFRGDAGTLWLSSAPGFDSAVQFAAAPRGEWTNVPFVRPPFAGVEWGRAIFDLAEAIAEGRPHLATGAHAAHVVDICCGITEAAATGGRIAVTTTFPPPPPMAWAG